MSFLTDGDLPHSPAAERALRKGLSYTWLLAVAFLVGAPAAYLVANNPVDSYTAEGSLWIATQVEVDREGSTKAGAGRLMETKAWIELLRSREVLEPVGGEQLAEDLTVRKDRRGNFLHLSLNGSDQTEVANVLNAVMERYVHVVGELTQTKVMELQTVLESQLRSAELRFEQAGRDLEEHRIGKILTAPDGSALPPGNSTEEEGLRRKLQIAENLQGDLQARVEAARIAAVNHIPDVRILDRASVTGPPNRDVQILIALAIFFGCVAAALGGALVLNRTAAMNSADFRGAKST
jgi:uncharacterized protein involved in exopolysaccharide biosynthesis